VPAASASAISDEDSDSSTASPCVSHRRYSRVNRGAREHLQLTVAEGSRDGIRPTGPRPLDGARNTT
jgi:hypothetical protein